MKRARSRAVAPKSAEELLHRAMAARTAATRARYARQGLATPQALDRVTQSMLLRQLYLAHFEQKKFEKALEIGEQMVEMRVLLDVCRHDVARALVALGDIDAASGQLRLAARSAPARRRAFHLWTLGSVLFLAGRFDAAQNALQRAIRWSTHDRPLYVGHLALVRLASGEKVADMLEIIDQLEEAPCGHGYGRFVLGLLSEQAKRHAHAERYLRAFVKRTRAGRPALAIALSGEVRMAEKHLAKLTSN